MTWERPLIRAMGMNERVWRRHANPWSVWTRLATTPLLFWALWSFHSWGWGALGLLALLGIWFWLNPRIFPEPQHTRHWSAQGVMGERVWANRQAVPIPRRHQQAGRTLTLLSGLLFILGVVGVIRENFWLGFLGVHTAALVKVWFVDRMAWLFQDMKQHPAYQQWEY